MKLRQIIENRLSDFIFVNKLEEGEIDELEGYIKDIIIEAIKEDRKNIVKYAKTTWSKDTRKEVCIVDKDSIINASLLDLK